MTRLVPLATFVRRSWALAAYWFLGAALVVWITVEAHTTRLITFSPTADYWEHAAALKELIASPFAPGNPHVRSEASSPRYGPLYLVIALIARALGLDTLDAMTLTSCANMALFVGGCFWFLKSYFKDARAPLYGLLVLLVTWWDGWHYSNVYQLKILPSVAAYPSTTALGLTWLCWGSVTSIVRSGATPLRLGTLGLLTAAVLIVHPLTAAMTFSGMGLLAVLEPGGAPKVRARALGAILVGALASHFWPYFSPFEVLTGGKSGNTADWAGKAARNAMSGASKAWIHPLFYDPKQLKEAIGLSAPGFVCALGLLVRRQHLFIPLGLIAMSAVFGLNTIVNLPLGHRFVLLAMVYLHLALVWGCLWLTPGYADAPRALSRRWVAVGASLVLAAFFAVGLWHNVPAAHARARAVRGRLSPVLNYARQTGERAGPDAVVLARPRQGWAIPTFGPKIVAVIHPNPLVPDERVRERDVELFFRRSTDDETRDAILQKYSVTHVLASAREARALRRYLESRATTSQKLAAGFRLYTLTRTTARAR